MEGLTLTEQDGVSRSISDIPPNHYMMKIQTFSQLAKNKIETHHSSDFEAGVYKWYNNYEVGCSPEWKQRQRYYGPHFRVLGDDTSRVAHSRWEICATFRLFLHDQNENNYFTLEDIAGKRFHGTKLEHGFDKFVPLALFNDPAEGYLVNDACMIGAEVYVTQEKLTGKGEILSMVANAITYKHTWRIDNFSTITDECLESIPFNAADQTWKIQLYPKGKGIGKDNCISLFLALAEPEKLSPATKIYTKIALRILDQINAKHGTLTANNWYTASSSSWGWDRFHFISYFKIQSTGLLVKNSCIVEAEVTVNGMASAL